MDTKTFLVELSKSWAWPIAWGLLFFIYGGLITRAVLSAISILRNVQSIKFKEFEFTLNRKKVETANNEFLGIIQKLEKELLSNEQMSQAQKNELISKVAEAEAANEALRDSLIRQSTQITSYESPKTQLNPMRLIVKQLGANEVGMLSGNDEGKEQTRRKVQAVVEKVRRGEKIHPYLNTATIDSLVQQNLMDESGILTDAGLVSMLNWANHELKRPSPSYEFA